MCTHTHTHTHTHTCTLFTNANIPKLTIPLASVVQKDSDDKPVSGTAIVSTQHKRSIIGTWPFDHVLSIIIIVNDVALSGPGLTCVSYLYYKR